MSNEETNKILKENVSTLNEKEPSIEKTSDAIASDAPISNEIFKAKPNDYKAVTGQDYVA